MSDKTTIGALIAERDRLREALEKIAALDRPEAVSRMLPRVRLQLAIMLATTACGER